MHLGWLPPARLWPCPQIPERLLFVYEEANLYLDEQASFLLRDELRVLSEAQYILGAATVDCQSEETP